jgi:hypothetical protein
MMTRRTPDWSHGPVGAVVAAWPAVSLAGSYELSWSGSSARPGQPNTGRRPGTSATPRPGTPHRAPPGPQPPPPGSPAAASATHQTRHASLRLRSPRCQPSPPAGSVTGRYLRPAPSMTPRPATAAAQLPPVQHCPPPCPAGRPDRSRESLRNGRPARGRRGPRRSAG